MPYEYEVFDYEGNKIEKGVYVRYWDDDEYKREDIGMVMNLGEWEGDVDDDTGRSILNEPMIAVKFPNGENEKYHTSEWEHEFHNNPDGDPEMVYSKGKCEELLVVPMVSIPPPEPTAA